MYLYVFNKDLHDMLVTNGRACLREVTDVNGKKIWIFAASPDGEHFNFSDHDGYWVSPDLHMVF